MGTPSICSVGATAGCAPAGPGGGGGDGFACGGVRSGLAGLGNGTGVCAETVRDDAMPMVTIRRTAAGRLARDIPVLCRTAGEKGGFEPGAEATGVQGRELLT